MRNVSVDLAARTVTYEGGCLFGDVDSALAAHGLATVGGLYNQTGVGGLVLGGGHGFLTARHGLAIDNLVSVEMVLADGSIVEVSETQKPDLFWAVRGAGAQFGIVTRFTSRAHPQGNVWGGALLFTLDKVPELIAFATAFANRGEHYIAVMGLMYDDASLDAEVRAFKRELSDYITTTCGYKGKRAPGDPAPCYVNLEHEALSPEDAFGDHVEQLRELKCRYDPQNVFHKWHGVVVEPKTPTSGQV
ncbi:hypothetical protein NW755_014325 [Fusarium falciforme]|uniref:FAD-binding PCMH-type domain-containing protein n=1 Tax=Fusarium falciforme TaxID=195108 RepID=A0A9W8QUD0_9HYPO|nr:hypothetical protein NW755_014325 [Fusarium falciforme]